MQITGIFFISHNVFYPSQTKYQFFWIHQICGLQTLLIWTDPNFLLFGKELNPKYNQPTQNVFYPSQIKMQYLNHFYFLNSESFQFKTSLKFFLSKKSELFTTHSRVLTALKQIALENIMDFLLFPQCFLLYHRQKSLF